MALAAAGSKAESLIWRLRTTSKAMGARKKPTAEPTPALGGTIMRAMPSFGLMFAAEIRKKRVSHLRSFPQWR